MAPGDGRSKWMVRCPRNNTSAAGAWHDIRLLVHAAPILQRLRLCDMSNARYNDIDTRCAEKYFRWHARGADAQTGSAEHDIDIDIVPPPSSQRSHFRRDPGEYSQPLCCNGIEKPGVAGNIGAPCLSCSAFVPMDALNRDERRRSRGVGSSSEDPSARSRSSRARLVPVFTIVLWT